MKISLVQLFLGVIFSGVSLAYELGAQGVLSRPVNLRVVNMPLDHALNEIQKEADVKFAYRSALLPAGRKVTMEAKDEPLVMVLNRLLGPLNIGYEVAGSHIVLRKRMFSMTPRLLAEQRMWEYLQVVEKTLRGKVTDEKGEELPGVSILVKGTQRGVITDASGNFTIAVPDDDAILVFSFVGYTGQEIQVGNQTSFNVALKADNQQLEEVIVIGYGTMKKSDLTGAVSRVTLDEKSTLPNVSLSQALSGATAGVNVQAVGMAGGEPNLAIRGRTSLSASDNPLIVVDGIIYNGSINDINVNDVEHIDILKDASAAAVFGSRSANGVIIISTKKGKSDKPKINFDMYTGVQSMTNTPMKVMNAEQYAIRMVDYYYQQGLYTWYRTNPKGPEGRPVRPDVTNRNTVASYLRTQEEKDNFMAGNEVDWVAAVMRDRARIQNYNLSFSGSGSRVNYFISGSYTGEQGILKNDQFDRFTLRSNIESKVTDWITLGLNTAYSYRDYSGIHADLGQARVASPLANNDIGSLDFATYLTGESYMPNPLGRLTASNKDIRNNLFSVLSAKIAVPFVKGLTYDFNYSNTFYTRKNNTFYPVKISDGVANNGRAVRNPSEERNWLMNNILTYSRNFGDHDVNATLLYSREGRTGESYVFSAEGFSNPALGYNNMALGTILRTSEPSAWEEGSIAYMGRLTYQFKNRYMITGTIRKDGYSGFGANSKYATFPSVSLGWVLSEESFLNDNRQLYLKLRASYGHNGNQGIGRYSSFSRLASGAYVFGGTTSVSVHPNVIGNSNLAWEKTSSFNLGIDFGLFNQRVNGSVDLYKAETIDVLVQRALPPAAGYGSVWTNLGGIDNKGIDFNLNTVNFKRNNLKWETGFVFSINRDKITKLYGGENDRDVGNSWFVGESITAIYDYKMAGGVWTEQELFSGNILSGWAPGQYRYVDLDNNGTIEPVNDRTIIGNRAPNYRFSVTSNLSYKNFGLYFLINSIQAGNGYYLYNNYDIVNVSQRSDDVYRINQSAVRQYWTPENGVDNATGIYNSPPVASGIYEDRSFVRLQDVSLSYTFGSDLLKRAGGISNLQLFVSGKNLYTWTKWSGWDPEIMWTGDNTNNPLMRNFAVGLKLAL